jgi:ribosomal protein L29
MKNKKIEKFNKINNSDLVKEVKSINLAILNQRIDIANRKTKGIHRISELKKDIARINTIISAGKGKVNE